MSGPASARNRGIRDAAGEILAFAAQCDQTQRRILLRPLGRFGQPEEIASVVLFLASGLAVYGFPPACDVETRYHCARVVTDEERPTGVPDFLLQSRDGARVTRLTACSPCVRDERGQPAQNDVHDHALRLAAREVEEAREGHDDGGCTGSSAQQTPAAEPGRPVGAAPAAQGCSTASRSWTNARKPRNFFSRRRNHRLEIATEIRLKLASTAPRRSSRGSPGWSG